MSLQEARDISSNGPARWFAAYFDPLLAEHVRMLAGLVRPGQLLIVQIAEPPEPLLERRARAELVAGLSAVDYVVPEGAAVSAPPDGEVRTRFVDSVRRRADGARA